MIEKSVRVDPVRPWAVRAIVKFECGHDLPTKSRLIQAYPNLHTQSLFGPQFYAFQKSVVGLMNNLEMGDISVTIASGLSVESIGEWMRLAHERFGVPQFYERDGKTWDATMNRSTHELVNSWYAHVDDSLAHFHNQCYEVNGNYFGRETVVSYRMRGGVKSGHNDTSIANSIVNMSICFEVARRTQTPAMILVSGDDALVAVPMQANLESWPRLEAEYGIKPDARTFTDYRSVSFISGCWMRSEQTYAFVPKPGRLFARLFWSVLNVPERQRASYVNSVVQSLWPACALMPVVNSFLSAHVSQADKACRVVLRWWWESRRPPLITRCEFARRYHFSADQVDCLESSIKNAVRHPP